MSSLAEWYARNDTCFGSKFNLLANPDLPPRKGGHPAAQAFNNEHRADQIERVLAAGAAQNILGKCRTADVFRPTADVFEFAADGGVVAFDHLEVAVFVAGVADESGADGEMLAGDVRRGPRNPPRAVDHLLPEATKSRSRVQSWSVIRPSYIFATIGTRLRWFSKAVHTPASCRTSDSSMGEPLVLMSGVADMLGLIAVGRAPGVFAARTTCKIT